eukprot:TRINITY_DN113801_c0_g1_i1.p1 TRINITY_DN113801_c0_g1~~TRINITY_DN113801_c0_g1_i1.p1  ORF type:complete len:365 (-),score=78.88 TRINITY_DN113801_c0_g1_i1:68-1162(-)
MRRLMTLLFGIGGFMNTVQQQEDVRIADLRIYPVKSCGGISLASSRMAKTGLAWDRTLAIVNDGGVIQTQRMHRRLATIRPTLDEAANLLTLEADGMEEKLQVPLRGEAADGLTQAEVKQGGGSRISGMPVWKYPAAASEWLTRHLSSSPGLSIKGENKPTAPEKFHLVRYNGGGTGYQRRLKDDLGGDNALPEDQVAFPDLFPFLITSRESLAEVNNRLDEPVPMERFRPNIVVEGASTPFAEDKWAVVRAGTGQGAVTLRCLEQDPRCQIPSINQKTGEKDPRFEPTTTLRKFRDLYSFDPFLKAGLLGTGGPMFGIYATHGGQDGEVRVGDELRILEKSDADSLHEYWSRRKKWDPKEYST